MRGAHLTVFCLREMVLVGLKATRTTMCSPLLSPPWMPPDLGARMTVIRCPTPADGALPQPRVRRSTHALAGCKGDAAACGVWTPGGQREGRPGGQGGSLVIPA